MSTVAMSPGGPTIDKERERKMALELGGDDGRIDLHEEEDEGDEDEDAGDRRRIERWLEEQCRFGSMLGLGLDRESEVAVGRGDDEEYAAGGEGGSLGLGIGVVSAGGPSRADSPLLGFGWHWDSPETESLPAPQPPSMGLLPPATQPDASAPSTAYPSGVPSLSMSLSSTPSSSFTTVSSTAEVVVQGAHVKNNSNASNQPSSPTTTTTLDGIAKWGRTRSQSTASMLDSAYFHAQRPQAPLHQQQAMPMSPLPPSSPPTRRQSRAPSVSVVSTVVPPLPHSPMPIALHSALPNASNPSLNLVKSRSRAGSTSLSHLVGDARNAVYIDSEEVRERLDELLMGGGLEEEDEFHENEHEDEEEGDDEERRGVDPKERTRTPSASPYQTPEASSSQVYIGLHSRVPSAASASASSSRQVSRKGSVSVPLSRKGSVLGASGSPSVSRKPSSPSLSRKASMKRTESHQSVAVGQSHSKSHSQGGSITSLREHAHSHSRSRNHSHSKSSASSHPHSRAHSTTTTTTTHSASPSISPSLSSIAASASASVSALAPTPVSPITAPAPGPVQLPAPLAVPVPIQLPTQPGPRPTRPPPAPPLDLALVGNLVLTALEEGASGASASASAASVVVVREGDGMEGLSEDGAARLNVEGGDEMQRYSRADVDVGLFSVPSVHLPVVPPPTPLSPPLSYADVNDDAHGDEEGNAVVRPRPSGVGTRHALGMTSRWSLTSSIDEAEGVTEGKRNAKEKEKEKEKEKRKSFVAFVAAVAGGASSNADGGVGPGAGAGGGVGAGGLDVPGGSGENLMLSKDKDPKEKKRGRLASFISRLSYSGGANALVSPISEVPPPLPPMPTPTTPPASPILTKTPTSTLTKSQYQNQFKQQPPPLMQRLAEMASDDALLVHNNPSQSQGLLLPSPEIWSGNPGSNSGSRHRESSDDYNRDHDHVDSNVDPSSSLKTREVKGVWEPIQDGRPPPPPKLRARSNSAADLLSSSTSSRIVGQEYQYQQQHQQQQRWPRQYADIDDRDIVPPPPGMRGRSSSAADLLGLGLARRVGGYESQQQQQQQPQQYQRHPPPHPHAAPHTPTSSFDAEAPSNPDMHTRPPLYKSASASILSSTPSPPALGTHTIPRMPSRPPPPPPKSKAMMMRIQTGFRGVDAAASPASPVSPGGGGVPLTAMLGQGPASVGNDDEQEGEGVVVDGDAEAVVVQAEQEEEDEEEDEDEEDYGVVVSRPQNRMLRDHEEERWVGESYGQQHQPQQQHQQQFAPAPPTPTMSPRPGMSIASPKFPIPSPQAMKVETALMALAPSLPSVSSPHSQPPYGQQYYHPNEESSSDGIQQQQQQTQGRGLSLTTRLRSMSSLGNLHVSPSSPASSSAVVSAGSPPLSALSSSSPFGLPSSPAVSPSTPTVPGNGKENVSGRESGIKGSGSGGALSTLLLGIQKKAPKRKLVVSGVAMGDVDAYEAVKRWCEGFGQVRDISRAPNGCLYVDFKKASVAETVCRIQAQVYIKGAGSVSLDWYTKKPPV